MCLCLQGYMAIRVPKPSGLGTRMAILCAKGLRDRRLVVPLAASYRTTTSRLVSALPFAVGGRSRHPHWHTDPLSVALGRLKPIHKAPAAGFCLVGATPDLRSRSKNGPRDERGIVY